MLDILYFASFREVLGQSQEKLALHKSMTVENVLTELAQRGGVWSEALQGNKNLQIAVNQDVANRHTALKAGDELAFFPPVTGG